jgi:hypothetical protein
MTLVTKPGKRSPKKGEEVVMTVMTHEPSTGRPDRKDIASRLLVPQFWATLSIIIMWLAVLFVGVFGGDMNFSSPPNNTTIPSAVAVALFAVIGTSAIAKRAFGRKNTD